MGGPSSAQKAAQAQTLSNSQSEGKLAKSSADKFNSIYGDLNPFYSKEMTNGLPFYDNLADFDNGTTARAYAPIKGAFNRSTSTMAGLPSGFRAAGIQNIDEARAHAFDDSLKQSMFQNYAAKQAGAAGKAGLMQIVNPAAFFSGSSSSGSAAMQPLQAAPNPWMSVLGGAVQGATSALPF
jgi:hypothetical protein